MSVFLNCVLSMTVLIAELHFDVCTFACVVVICPMR